MRAAAAVALGEIGDGRVRAALERLAGDGAPARIYVGDDLVTKPVREWAAGALRSLEAA